MRIWRRPKPKTLWMPIAIALAIISAGCLGTDLPNNLNVGATQGSSAGSGGNPNAAAFQSASAVKVVFNKQSFYNNHSPNASGCAGDAKIYYDPSTDRQVPARPGWLRNVAVELTNSNALDGPSNATGCALNGSGSPNAANCATFDDLQPLSGAASRAVMLGGLGCSSNTSGCSAAATPPSLLGDIWEAFVPGTASQTTWSKQAPPLSVFGSSAGNGVAWAGGDYDQLHNEFFLYGGVNAPSGSSSNLSFSNAVVKVDFNADGSVSTSSPPSTPAPSATRNYAGWSLSDAVTANFNTSLAAYFSPPPLAGDTFTYSPRRDATSKSWCRDGDAVCNATNATGQPAQANNEHSDYFLLVGGLHDGTGAAPFAVGNAYRASKHFWMYKPHGISNSTGAAAPSGGDWSLLSNDENAGAGLSLQVMKVIEIASTGSSAAPFVPAAAAWNGRAFHRTVYDPTMNRFYIFGGIETSGDATTTTPTLGANDVWMYDPPALGRRPTAACFSAQTPDAASLPATSATLKLGTAKLDVNRAYLADKFVFPPGGCLQRVALSNAPNARFEHAMAFDREQKAMLVFGGCNAPSTIAADGTAKAGDPTASCANSAALYNDTWMYLPPTATEIVSKDYVEGTLSNTPYSADGLAAPFRRLANVFGTDFWLDHQPLFANDNASSSPLTQPTADQVMGTWIQLSPAQAPFKRASASFYYDRAHQKFYLQGGFGCRDAACADIGTLNDLWEFTPPDIASQCSRANGACVNNGAWTRIKAHSDSAIDQPPPRKGAVIAHAEGMFSFADDFYTVTDSACVGQGPIITGDASSNKQFVGAVYIDIDRGQIPSGRHLLINLRLLPFDENTKLPGAFDNNTPSFTTDDTENASFNDKALIRVSLLNNPVNFWDSIQALVQPRFHEFISGAPVIARELAFAAGGTGQVTEKQILIPLDGIDDSFDMIKIERMQGSVKFYEMSLWQY